MNDSDLNELANRAMADRLTPEEEAVLAGRPELADDLALGRALSELPPPPRVSTNFTARILQAVRAEERAAAKRPAGWLAWLRLPRLARVTAIAALAMVLSIAILQNRRSAERELIEEVAEVAKKANPEASEAEAVVTVLSDFEAIRHLPPSEPEIDTTLLSALTE